MKPTQRIWLLGEPIILENVTVVTSGVTTPSSSDVTTFSSAEVLESAALHHLGATLDELASSWRCPICEGAAPPPYLCDECERAMKGLMVEGELCAF